MHPLSETSLLSCRMAMMCLFGRKRHKVPVCLQCLVLFGSRLFVWYCNRFWCCYICIFDTVFIVTAAQGCLFDTVWLSDCCMFAFNSCLLLHLSRDTANSGYSVYFLMCIFAWHPIFLVPCSRSLFGFGLLEVGILLKYLSLCWQSIILSSSTENGIPSYDTSLIPPSFFLQYTLYYRIVTWCSGSTAVTWCIVEDLVWWKHCCDLV